MRYVTELSAMLLCLGLLLPGVLFAQKTPDSSGDRRDQRGYLGVQPAPLNEGIRDMLETDRKEGVVLMQILPDTPAERAGLKKFDLVVKVDGTSVGTIKELARKIRSKSPGDSVTLHVIRDGKRKKVDVTLGSSPDRPKVKRKRDKKQKDEKGPPEHVKEFMKRLDELNGEKNKPKAKESAEELRERMKEFLKENPPEDHGKKNGNEDIGSKMSKFLKKLKKEYGNSLPDDLLPENKEELRKLSKRFRKLLEEEEVKKLKNQIESYLRKLEEKKDQLASSDTARRLEDFLDKWNDRFDRSLDRFEEKFGRKMEQYFDRLDRQLKELKKLKERLREGGAERKQTKQSNRTEDPDRPYLGIRAKPAPDRDGILIGAVASGSPASRAGLKSGDLILEMNGSSFSELSAVKRELYRHRPGDRIRLLVERDGWKKEMTIKLGSRKEEKSGSSESGARRPSKSRSDQPEKHHEKSEPEPSSTETENRNNSLRMVRNMLSSVMRDVSSGEEMLSRIHSMVDMLKWQLKGRSIKITGRFRVRDGQGRTLFRWSGRQDPLALIELVEAVLPE